MPNRYTSLAYSVILNRVHGIDPSLAVPSPKYSPSSGGSLTNISLMIMLSLELVCALFLNLRRAETSGPVRFLNTHYSLNRRHRLLVKLIHIPSLSCLADDSRTLKPAQCAHDDKIGLEAFELDLREFKNSFV